jgi:hypothetical protein
VSVARILIWNLADSKTTLEELREKVRALPEGDHWIADPAGERFGLLSFSGTTAGLQDVRDLIGKDPEIGEEFELL